MASEKTQLMVTTHSPYFVNAINPKELWMLFRDQKGFTHSKCASEMKGIGDFSSNGALLGDLWMEGFFEFGDPLVNAGGPAPKTSNL